MASEFLATATMQLVGATAYCGGEVYPKKAP